MLTRDIVNFIQIFGKPTFFTIIIISFIVAASAIELESEMFQKKIITSDRQQDGIEKSFYQQCIPNEKLGEKISTTSESKSQFFSTYLGGSEEDYASSVATDSQDNIILIGNTNSSDFPTLNAYDSSYNGNYDAYIAKYKVTGEMEWCTLIGGSNDDYGHGVAVDSQNNIIVVGSTSSYDFPTLNASDNASKHSGSDAFIAKFSPIGELKWSTYLGGSGNEFGIGVAIDTQDNIILTGGTSSSNFPILNASDDLHNGDTDVFLVKLNTLGVIKWSTFMGGNNYDVGSDVVIDTDNNVIIQGTTYSADFPTLNAFDSSFIGNEWNADLFISKFSTDGIVLWSTFLSGEYPKYSYAIAIDSQNNIILPVISHSVISPVLNPKNPSVFDILIVKLTSIGVPEWSTFIGGRNSHDFGADIVIDSHDNIYITGTTVMDEEAESNDFPVLNAYDTTYNGAGDVVGIKFKSTGILDWSTFIGGNKEDGNRYTNIAIDSQDNVIITGNTESNDFPMYNAYEDEYKGNFDAFIYYMPDPLIDADSDGLTNIWEYQNGLNLTNSEDAQQDYDKDNLINIEEYNHGLDPNDPDSDNDGTLDGEELNQWLLDPSNSFLNPTSKMLFIILMILVPVVWSSLLLGRWKFRPKRN